MFYRGAASKPRKSERGHIVVKYRTYQKEDEQRRDGEYAEMLRDLKAYNVFGSAQIEGIGFPQLENLPNVSLTAKTIRFLV